MKEQRFITKAARDSASLNLVEPERLIERIRQTYEATARRAFEIFENNGRRIGNDLEDWFKAESEFLYPVRLDVEESDDALIVRADVPGFSADELEVSVEPKRLTVSGKKRPEKEPETAGKTRYPDQLLRVLDLPVQVDPSKATATLKGGTLELRVPRVAKSRKVRVETNAA